MYSHIQERRKRIRPVKFNYRYMTIKDFGEIDQNRVRLYCIKNSKGSEVRITNYGGIVTSWITRDNKGNYTDVLNGFDSLQDCIEQHVDAPTAFNLNQVRWRVEIAEDYSLLLHREWNSYDDHQLVKVNITKQYKYTDDNELIIEYKASSNAIASLNLTDMLRFRLGNNITEHEVMINARMYRLENNNYLEKAGAKGNEGNYILAKKTEFSKPAATLTYYDTGRRLEVYTDKPLLYLSTHDNAICLNPKYNGKILYPEESFHSTTKYKIVHL